MNNWESPIHPGEILADELEEINLDVFQLAKRVNILDNELEQILKGQGNITGYAEQLVNILKGYRSTHGLTGGADRRRDLTPTYNAQLYLFTKTI